MHFMKILEFDMVLQTPGRRTIPGKTSGFGMRKPRLRLLFGAAMPRRFGMRGFSEHELPRIKLVSRIGFILAGASHYGWNGGPEA